MLSISSAKTAGGAVAYFSDHLVIENPINPNEDYYIKPGEAGQWIGNGATLLGLTGEVNIEDFGRTLLGIDQNGKELVQQSSGKSERRAGWDLTFSAPKSVSALWAAGDEKLRSQIQQAHEQAAMASIQWIQENGGISATRGKGGKIKENAKLVAAKFDHGTSREQDPQLHSHFFVMNLAQRADFSWGAIDSREFFKRKMAAGAIYRVSLSSAMQQLNFEITREKRVFKVEGIAEKLINKWSTRRKQILDKMAEHGSTTAKGAEKAALSTRKTKEQVDQDQLVERWQEEAAEHGLTPETITELQQAEKEIQKIQTVDKIWEELTEQVSTLGEHQLSAAIFERAQGTLSIDEAKSFLAEFIKNKETVILRDHSGARRFTSQTMLHLEQAMIDNAKNRKNEEHALKKTIVEMALAMPSTISDEQRKMVEHITADDGVSIVEGMAGTGKSFALRVANEAWLAEGYTVIGAALAGNAADGLEEGSNIKSGTLHKLIYDLEDGKIELDNRHVLVIDEAGMIGSKMLKNLLDKADDAGAKVVLVGDSLQLQAIDAGAAFRGLSKALGAAKLTNIRRQNQKWHREAVGWFSEGQAGKALKEFKERGLLKSGKTHFDTIHMLVQQWQKDRLANENTTSLIVTGTRADTAITNQHARLLMGAELMGDAVEINGNEFQQNDRVIFGKTDNMLGVKNGRLGTVLDSRPEEQSMIVQLDGKDQKIITITEDRFGNVSHGYAMTVHKSQGDTVDRVYALADERMSGREWSYVAMSRSRDDTHIYADQDLIDELEQVMSKSQAKDLSIDYEVISQQTEKPNLGEEHEY